MLTKRARTNSLPSPSQQENFPLLSSTPSPTPSHSPPSGAFNPYTSSQVDNTSTGKETPPIKKSKKNDNSSKKSEKSDKSRKLRKSVAKSVSKSLGKILKQNKTGDANPFTFDTTSTVPPSDATFIGPRLKEKSEETKIIKNVSSDLSSYIDGCIEYYGMLVDSSGEKTSSKIISTSPVTTSPVIGGSKEEIEVEQKENKISENDPVEIKQLTEKYEKMYSVYKITSDNFDQIIISPKQLTRLNELIQIESELIKPKILPLFTKLVDSIIIKDPISSTNKITLFGITILCRVAFIGKLYVFQNEGFRKNLTTTMIGATSYLLTIAQNLLNTPTDLYNPDCPLVKINDQVCNNPETFLSLLKLNTQMCIKLGGRIIELEKTNKISARRRYS